MAAITFEEVQKGIETFSDSLIDKSKKVKETSLQIYDDSFFQLQPILNDIIHDYLPFLNQIPEGTKNCLPFEVKRINEQYLESKKYLLNFYKDLVLSTYVHKQVILKEFSERRSQWVEHRIETLTEDSKFKLGPSNPIDYGDIFSKFKKDQNNFSQVFLQLIQDLTLITPPDSFAMSNLDHWWASVEENLTFFNNFIFKIQK